MQKKPKTFRETLATVPPRSHKIIFEAIGHGLCSGTVPTDLVQAIEAQGMPREVLFDEICDQIDAMPSLSIN